MSVNAKLGAGSKFEFEVKPDTGDYSGTYSKAGGIQSLGAVGDEGESKDKTCIDDTLKVYGAGLLDSQDMEIPLIYDIDDTGQVAFTDACKARKEMRVKVTWSNDVVGIFDYQSFGFKINETTADGWIMVSTKGKKNTEVDWTTVAELAAAAP